MARKFLVPIDLTQQELQNARVQNLASAPSSPVAGQIYYNTTSNLFFVYNGTTWLQASTAISATTPNAVTIAGTGAAGSSTSASAGDHTHAGPGFAAPTATTTFGLSAVTGTATTTAHADHTHGTPSLSSTTPTAITSSTGAIGSGTTAAIADHAHGFTAGSFALSAFAVPTGSVSFNSQKITSLLDPTAAQDAATKNYVDTVAQGLNFHDGVEAATTANLAYTYVAGSAGADGGTGVGATLSNTVTGTITIDGHLTALGDRVLFKNQTTALQNGIYIVTTAGATGVTGVFTRSTDYDNHISGQVMAGDFVFIAAGTVNNATTYVQSATGTSTTPINGIKLGTDSLTFIQFGASTSYTAGNGITLAGSAFSFAPLSTGGLTVGGTGTTAAVLLPTNSGLGTSASGLAVGAGTGITVTTGTVNIDTTVVARKYSTTLATSATSYTVTHNLGTLDVHVQVYLISDGSEVMVDNLRATTNTVTINFSVAPTASAYRVVVLG